MVGRYVKTTSDDHRYTFTGYTKLGCVVPMVISSEFHMRQYRDDDHREYAPHCKSKLHIGVKLFKLENRYKL